MSGPARGIGRALDTVAKSFHGLEVSQEKALDQKRAKSWMAGTTGWERMALGLNQVLGVAGSVGGALESVGGQALGLAYAGAKYAVEATSFKQNTERALTAILRSKEAAADVLESATKFAAKTPFETKDVMQWSKSLLVGGFSTKELPVLLKAVGDFGALNDMDTGKITGLVEHLNKVKAEGKLTGRVMEELAVSGINAGKIYERLGKMFGTTAEGARKLESAGKIDAQHGLFAIISQIKEMGGGKLGSLLEEASMGVEGLLSTIRSRPFELFKDMDKTAGFESFRLTLSNVADLLDPAGAFGARLKDRLQATFGGAFQTVFGQLGGGAGKATLEAGLNKVLDLIDGAMGAVRVAWPFLREFVGGLVTGLQSGLGPLGKVISALAGADGSKISILATGFNLLGRGLAFFINVGVYAVSVIGLMVTATGALEGAILSLPDEIQAATTALSGWVSQMATNLQTWGGSLGSSLVEGITQGIEIAAGAFLPDAIGTAADLAINTWRSLTGTHSPSTVFEGLGRGIPQGLAMGIDGASNEVPDAIGSIPTTSAVSFGGGGGDRPISVSVEVHIHGADAATTEGVLARINTEIRRAVEDALRGAAVESGASAA